MSLPAPYYERDGLTIFNADCRDVLPFLDPVDLVLTDPPYPKLKGGLSVTLGGGVADRREKTETMGTPWVDPWEGLRLAWALAELGAFVFTSWHTVPDVPKEIEAEPCALLTWHKRNSTPPICNVPHFTTEFIWAFKKAPGIEWRRLRTLYDIPGLPAGCMATERVLDGTGKSAHPNQKPEALFRALMASGGQTILDPFMGSGTTLVAARDLGRRAIGIEIEESYCRIAVDRLRQGVLPFVTAD